MQYESTQDALTAWHQWALRSVGLTSPKLELDAPAVPMRRADISRSLGGNTQSTYTSGRDGRVHVLIKQDHNPFLPRVPGAHGLMYTFSWRAKDDADDVLLFVRDAREAVWTYMGEYMRKAMRELSPEEWRIQPQAVRRVLLIILGPD